MEEDSREGGEEQLHHVLVVDDNPGDGRLIEEALGAAPIDHTIHTVTTGEGAIDYIHQRNSYDAAPRPDVVLLDWSLRTMEGSEVLSRVKSDFPDMTVVVMTGSPLKTRELESNVPQADAFLTKPTDPDDYVEVILSLE